MAQRVLIVDDDPVQRRLLENMVAKSGFEPVLATGGDAAIALLTDPVAPLIDCIVLDLVMPDLDGLGVLAQMRELGLSIPVIVQTAHGGIDNVVTAMRAGAVDFVVKPVGPERLLVSLTNALTTQALAGELSRIKRSRTGTLTVKDVVTRNERMRGVLRAAEKAAGSSIPVLIQGESGVGKELIARAIHGSGARREKPFVAVNCGAMPDALVESILFGHEKGAFTGAAERHIGKFVEASGGTLFLDEVGELPPAAQVKLLRAIQDGEVEPVGARRPTKVDVRLMSATNRNLIDEVAAGRFRDDLFYRLHVFPITVPPLRQRREDVPDLVRHFLLRFAAEEGRRVRVVSAAAMRLLIACDWPGNVRQLENAMFRAVVLADSDELGVGEFPQLTGCAALVDSGLPDAAPCPDGGAATSAMLATADAALLLDEAASPPPAALPLLTDDGEVRRLDAVEADAIRFALAHYRGQLSEVARRLGIGRSTLYRKLDGLGLTSPAETAETAAGASANVAIG